MRDGEKHCPRVGEKKRKLEIENDEGSVRETGGEGHDREIAITEQ